MHNEELVVRLASLKKSAVRRPTPFVELVPKEFHANLNFREAMILRGNQDPEFAAQLVEMCRQDMLFYINTFCYTYDPRKKPAAIPWITWEFQDECLMDLDACIDEGQDAVIEKSRDMGASWMCLAVLEWRWHFHPRQSFLVVSRKEEYVDKSDDPKSLFWKIDFIHKYQPPWLLPSGFELGADNPNRVKLGIHNHDNDSTIDGESTNGDVARGDRRTAIFLDEFASVENGWGVNAATADATNCRIKNSTPKGCANAFYEDRCNPSTRVYRLHWTLHPEKAAGLYFDDKGKPRSPWYDREVSRRGSPIEIAQELDIDYHGSDSNFFDAIVIDEHVTRYSLTPYWIGEATYDELGRDCHLYEKEKGCLELWVFPDERMRIASSEYVIAADISNGTGASNSALSIGDKITGQKVAQFISPHVRPEQLAVLAVSLGRLFCNHEGHEALLIWESNGPGRNFGDRVLELGYSNIWLRRRDEGFDKRVSDIPGFASTQASKLSLLGEYRRLLATGKFINRSRRAVEECRSYIHSPTSGVKHSRSETNPDPSGARDNHGDIVIADALLARLLNEAVIAAKPSDDSPPQYSFAERRKHYRDAMKDREEYSY